MNITELVRSINTPYYETVASRLPRGIESQQHLLNLGYVITVQDLGLSRAKTLDESFAVNLINSYHRQCINEGVGSFLGKAAGNVVGAVGAAGRGIKNAWNDAKQGYKDAKTSWDPKTGAPPAGGTTPAPVNGTTAVPPPASGGTEPAPAAPPSTYASPAASGDTGRPYVAQPDASPAPAGDMGSIMQAIDKLDKPTKQQLAGELEKSINTPEPAADKPGTAPGALGATPPAAPGATPPAPGAAPATEPQGSIYDPAKAAADKLAKGQADQQLAQQQMAATQQANAATNQQDADIKAAADAAKAKSGFQQTAADKLAIKAAADKGIREAKEKKKKLKKKVVAEFKSNFLGMII
jgi:hypothetical protein